MRRRRNNEEFLTRDQKRALIIPVSLITVLVVAAIYSVKNPQTPRRPISPG